MSRRQAREAALQALCQLDLNPAESPEKQEMTETLAVDTALDVGEKMSKRSREYLEQLVHGTLEHRDEIDERIARSSKDWKVSRMAPVDRNICRIAAWEIFYSPEKLDAGIAINEAVELAKRYGTDDSKRYVNGILGAMVKLG